MYRSPMRDKTDGNIVGLIEIQNTNEHSTRVIRRVIRVIMTEQPCCG